MPGASRWVGTLCWSRPSCWYFWWSLFLIHATGFFGFAALGMRDSPRQTFGIFAGLTVFYFLIIWGTSAIVDPRWPMITFAWLLVGKVQLFFTLESDRNAALMHLGFLWSASVVSFLGGLFAAILMVLPVLGLTAEVAAQLGFGINDTGALLDAPHVLIGAGPFISAPWRSSNF